MKTIREVLEYLLFLMVKMFVFILPRPVCLSWGRMVGSLAYFFDKKHRLIAQGNLKTAFAPQISTQFLRKTSLECFQNFGQVVVDTLKFSFLSHRKKSRILAVEGEKNLDQALNQGRGVLLFSAHYGNWEIASFFFSQKGKLKVIARPLDNKLLDKQLQKIRKNLGSEVISKYQATRPILHSLGAKEMVAFLIDQNVLHSQAVFVDFFGKKAATTPSLATFFSRTRAPLVPAFCYPLSSDRYVLKIHPPVHVSQKGHPEDVLKITQICTKIIEAQIRKNPNYWFWFHRRWKTRPEGEDKDRQSSEVHQIQS
ncbi:MAG: lysophospholipid acyltransferase family protein [Candidatus Aminicenantes bacterium]